MRAVVVNVILMVFVLFSWADSDELWRSMVEKETIYRRSSGYMANHPDLQPRMRAILLDWLMEVKTFVLSQVQSLAAPLNCYLRVPFMFIISCLFFALALFGFTFS